MHGILIVLLSFKLYKEMAMKSVFLGVGKCTYIYFAGCFYCSFISDLTIKTVLLWRLEWENTTIVWVELLKAM